MRSRVLCVDDQSGVRLLLKEILKDEYDVITVGSGKEAIELAKVFNPNIVMLDMNLDDMLGTEVLKVIRQFHSSTKFIMLTGYSEDDKMKEISRLNPDFIVKKPFDVETIKDKLKKITTISKRAIAL
ncbi:response regulator receiver protein, CheY-like protein [Gottschalkia purinilytica]|uniref:Response regulator receiver protein, CheY-like protein n=1 Tax=Gottschalkia purinilytica TaxID=1503 RepID=A0A0L0WEA1_GOTPU|nr:response regulator [Gottschalkia purinilytica]KNF09750.1 response regulator receiver protein, CheY-like protein [Gottschalkia purinilytica]